MNAKNHQQISPNSHISPEKTVNSSFNSDSIDCVMPAAGMSSRMGVWKMMLTYRKHTILDESIENALGFCSRVILVTGFRADELVDRYCNDKRILLVNNQHYEQGIFSSMQAGSKYVESEHYFICHGDMPCVDKQIYQQMWQYRGELCVFPGTERKWGHPALIPATVIKKITSKPATVTMKPILKEHGIHFLDMDNPDIHFDVDTPEEYQQLIR